MIITFIKLIFLCNFVTLKPVLFPVQKKILRQMSLDETKVILYEIN